MSKSLISLLLLIWINFQMALMTFFSSKKKSIHHVADINASGSIEVFGIPIHPDWECLPPPARDSQVAIYVHK